MTNWQQLEKTVITHLTPILFVTVIAGASFLLGFSMNHNSSEGTAVNSPTPQATTATASIIGDIQQSINGTNSAEPATTQASASTTKSGQGQTGLVNLNTADQTQLETLPGIGPSKAQAIIDYRTQNGDFVQIDDLTKVKGIGPKTFDSLKSLITV